MRMAGVLAWALALAVSLVLLWYGVYRVVAPDQTGSPLCGGVDLPWFLAGVLVNLVAAGIAFSALGAGWWTLGIALPALAAVVVQMLLPCSFVLPLVLPAAALLSVASAVVVIVLAVRRTG